MLQNYFLSTLPLNQQTSQAILLNASQWLFYFKSDHIRSSQIQITMKEIYLLVPLIKTNRPQIEDLIESTLTVTRPQYQCHEFQDQRYAIELNNLNIGYIDLIQIIKEEAAMKIRLEVLKEAIKKYQGGPKDNSIQMNNIDSLMKKAIKYKEIKEENKKLKKLLQSQLQNTQKVRQETQKTMKVLREQFDTLVKEMNRQATQRSSPSRDSGGVEMLQAGLRDKKKQRF